MVVTGPILGRQIRRLRAVRLVGMAVVALSLLGMVAGLLAVGSLGDDYRATVSVSRSAVSLVAETVDAVDEIASEASESMESAARSVDGASATLDQTVIALEEVAFFLEEGLTEDLTSVRAAMPAAIQAAGAIDATLRALSLLGVDYDPEESLGQSLRRIDTALAGLPAELRGQAETMRRLIPPTTELAGDTAELSAALEALSSSVARLDGLADGYQQTIGEAQATIEDTGARVESRIWLLRLLVILAGLVGMGVGASLMVMADTVIVPPLETRPVLVERVD